MRNRLLVFVPIVLPGFALLAQSLPSLNVTSAGNHQVSVTWPYTNSGFVFQETTNLKTAAWSSSALAVNFSSNSATFAVSATATNSAKFFRLAQPVDLRGIYVVSDEISQLATNDAAALSASFQVPGVDGCVLLIGWNHLETGNGRFVWSNADYWVSNAAAAGLKVDFSVKAGVNTPKWLFDPATNGGAGATPLTFAYSPLDGYSSDCDVETIAAPWDTNFLSAWSAMLAALSTHFKTNGNYDAVKSVRLTGINRNTGELHLPAPLTHGKKTPAVLSKPVVLDSRVGFWGVV